MTWGEETYTEQTRAGIREFSCDVVEHGAQEHAVAQAYIEEECPEARGRCVCRRSRIHLDDCKGFGLCGESLHCYLLEGVFGGER